MPDPPPDPSADQPADQLPDLTARLRAAGSVFAEDEAALLLDAASPDHETAQTAETAEALETLVVRRLGGEPLEQVLGWVDFAGVRVRLLPGVFVPRQRTALLVELAAAVLAPADIVVDLCCGSGALLAAVLRRHPTATGHAADLDPAAVACARLNLSPDRVHQGDLYAALPDHLRGRIDVLVVNAPYVPTAAIAQLPPEARDHEPHLALDGGADGLDLHRRVARGACEWLARDGMLLIEVSVGQLAAAMAMLTRAGLTPEVVEDEERGALAVRARPRTID
ncbi:putative protein N(5)-glutamine methyltransferase [Nocardioides sp.]|uniref:putative protein N(5)-glutamine methyltransferase n=1 Tax=Nocardioides sp. TaxID=35761 RepID=UPI00261DBDDE|nr:putative protein N(5)-glutamine methyltransferase [Nocardioides sp.]